MKIAQFKTADEFQSELMKRLKDFDQRERIVISMPYACNINRIEIYCSETAPTSSAYSGSPFIGIVKLSQYNDYTNKSVKDTSYTYKEDLFKFIPRLCNNLFSLIN